MKITELLGKKIIVFDGGMGTQLQAAGLAVGEYPDPWNILHGEKVKAIHKNYLRSGCDVVTTNTFGSNRINLDASEYTVDEVIGAAVNICKEAISEVNEERKLNGLAEREMFTALDIGPSGKIVDLMGELDFDGAYELFKEEIIAGTKACADFIIFETFSDIVELKAGIIAAKENSNLPIFCTMTFQEDGRMLMGTDPETAILALQDMGIDAIGVNCSLGPKELLPIISRIMKVSRIPVIAQPNAGLPKMKDGIATYDISEVEFAEYAIKLLELGVSIIGGCCGTTPKYIEKLSEMIKGKSFSAFMDESSENIEKSIMEKDAANESGFTFGNEGVICTTTKHLFMGNSISMVIEDSIDLEALKEDILAEDFEEALDIATSYIEEDVTMVAINAEFAGEKEGEILKEIVHNISLNGSIPIAIFSNNTEFIEGAVRYCRGRPLILFDCAKADKIKKINLVSKKYGVDIFPMKNIEGIIVGIKLNR